MRFVPAFILALLLISTNGCHLFESLLGNPARKLEGQGTYTHRPSRMQFPETVGAFHREEVTVYDRAGINTSVGYKLARPGTSVGITVYVYPAITSISNNLTATPQAQFDKAKWEVWKIHPKAVLVSQGGFRLKRNGQFNDGRFAFFNIEQDTHYGPHHSFIHLYVFRYVNHYIRYNIVSLQPYNDPLDAEVTQFISELRWPDPSQEPDSEDLNSPFAEHPD